MTSPVASGPPYRVVYILRSFPRLSQTFVLNELLALEALGIDITVIALVRADEKLTHEGVDHLRADVVFLDELHAQRQHRLCLYLRFLRHRPLRFLRAAARLAFDRNATWGYHGITRRQAFDLGVRSATTLGLHRSHNVGRLHAHFAHDPALLALVVSDLSGVPFSFTGHARDLVQISPRALGARVAAATAVLTCCQINADLITAASGGTHGHKVHVIRHGVDVEAFAPLSDPSRRRRRGIVSVGRLIDKKGFDVLIDAVALVVGWGVDVHLTIVGEGPDRPVLAARIASGGLADHVTLAGECTQAEMQRLLPTFDVFALTPCVGRDGDRDGLPTVLVEAMACGLPVVTTDVAGIPDLVEQQVNGFMCPPLQPLPVADALRLLLTDEHRRRRMGAAARASVLAGFDAKITSRLVADLLNDPAPGAPRRVVRRDGR